jgi:flavin reductase
MINNQIFRDAMARLPAGVTIVTSDGPAGNCGVTASSVCSVSDEPPTLLVCIKRSSRNNTVFKQNQRVCVNVLRSSGQDLASQFAQSSQVATTRFAEPRWTVSTAPLLLDDVDAMPALPLPVLKDALVSLQCRITDQAEVGSHTVFYCTVDDIQLGTPGSALVYFERQFHGVSIIDTL